MDNEKKAGRYERIIAQLNELLTKTSNPLSRMATIIAVLHNKMDNFSWTGYYHLTDGELLVGAYQGPLACQLPPKNDLLYYKTVPKGTQYIIVVN